MTIDDDAEIVEIFPPGDYIKDMIEDRGWIQSDLAEILGRPLQMVNEIILGKRGITPETAKGLAEALGTSAQLWLNLDAAWQLYRTRDTDPSVGIRARVYANAPVREMLKRGWVEPSTNPEVFEQRVLNFLEVDAWGEAPNVLPAAAKMATPYGYYNPGQWAWLCAARKMGAALTVEGSFDDSKRDQLVGQLQALMAEPAEIRHVPRILSKAGVRFLVLEHLNKTKIDGACVWLDRSSPIIVLSLRYDRIDHFWFTLMHEIKHAFSRDGLNSGVPILDIDLLTDTGPSSSHGEWEPAANEFAQASLIEPAKVEDFLARKGTQFSESDVLGFALLNHVHAGIALGQLHFRTGVYAKFRPLLVKIKDIITSTALTDGWGHRVQLSN